MRMLGCHQFRVTRNSNLWVDEEEVADLRSALKGELHGRKFGRAVRLEVADNCTDETARFLAAQHNLDQQRDVYIVNGPVNLHRLAALNSLVSRPELTWPKLVPSLGLPTKGDLFARLRQRSVLLHHPFESMTPVVDLVWRAAKDPDVLAIKQTLYRTSSDSPFVAALADAARSGKEVTAVIELRARFDEAANIHITNRLEQAGASVVYGVVGHKCHAKMLLIVRREGKKLNRYCHLGTGNYHTGTAKAYTDYSLLTADSATGEDVHALFMELTGLGKVPKTRKLLHSPFTLKRRMLAAIRAEAKAASEGKPAWIRAKFNSLTHPEIIRALYEASQAGVEIDLVVRGICRLRPGIVGVSETIRVRSIVGRFLEHTRVYAFANGGDARVYCSSADWMSRNLERRVEACFPIEETADRDRILKELDLYLKDGTAWELTPDGTYVRSKRRGQPAQQALLSRYVR
jgi:polyphosphate kinase